MTTSTNPNATSGRLNNSQEVLTFPLNEDLPRYTRLRFIKYSRFSPNVDPTETTTAIINLPLPISFSDTTSMRMSSIDLGSFGAVDLSKLNQSLSGIDSMSAAVELGQSVISDQIKKVEENFKISTLRGLALMPIMSDDKRRLFQLGVGVVNNPHATMIFEGVNLKGYNLTWRLSPRSHSEAEALQNIINTLKMRSSPEETFEGFALDYPDLCYVEWAGDVANYFPKMHKAFVNEVMVNVGAGNGIAFYKSGAPTEQEISIRLTEVRLVTRNVLREDLGITEDA